MTVGSKLMTVGELQIDDSRIPACEDLIKAMIVDDNQVLSKKRESKNWKAKKSVGERCRTKTMKKKNLRDIQVLTPFKHKAECKFKNHLEEMNKGVMECFTCGTPGHSKHACKKDPVKCTICKQTGHLAKYCTAVHRVCGELNAEVPSHSQERTDRTEVRKAT